MNEIQIVENKTLKLTNVLSRRITMEEQMNGSLPIINTQMLNFIKSNGAQQLGPLVYCYEMGANGPELVLMMQADRMIPKMEPGYHMDAVLRVKGCLYAHYVGPKEKFQLANAKLQVYAFEHDIELGTTSYMISMPVILQDASGAAVADDENIITDVFVEIKKA